jgi:hypothetical protein
VETPPWYERYFDFSPVYHHLEGQPIYVWSAIFAPSGLSTNVIHEWQRYDQQTHAWVTSTRVSFAIVGGRDGGFRGYSFKRAIEPGEWRVNVLTAYGQLIGRTRFTVIDATETPPLVDITP